MATAQSSWSVDSLYQSGQSPATHDRLMAPVSDLLNHKHLVLRVSQRSHLQAAFLPGQWLRYEFLGSTAHVYAEHRLEVPDTAEVKDLFYNAARGVHTCKLFYGGSRVGQIEDLQLEFSGAVRLP